MIIDSSAIIAVLRDESDAERYALALASSGSSKMSVVNWFETAIAIGSPAGFRCPTCKDLLL